MKINPFDIRTFPSFLDFKERFLSYFPKDYDLKENEDNCWLWQGSRYYTNYGQTSWGGKKYTAHQISYIIFNGLILEDQIVRHTCDNRRCVNPKHLILGTYHDNSIDMVKRNHQIHQKLTQEDVIEIKTALKKPYCGIQKELAKKFNVKSNTISMIKTNKAWAWLTI
jgi:hypothetical protein